MQQLAARGNDVGFRLTTGHFLFVRAALKKSLQVGSSHLLHTTQRSRNTHPPSCRVLAYFITIMSAQAIVPDQAHAAEAEVLAQSDAPEWQELSVLQEHGINASDLQKLKVITHVPTKQT